MTVKSKSCYKKRRNEAISSTFYIMKNFVYLLIFASCLLLIVPNTHADYVLPYPSYMPGNKIYRISRIADTLKSYWYFGNIAKVKYHLGLADKYLVEAKTLFEYKQYLLAVDALRRSSDHFKTLPVFLKNARGEGKDISQQKRTVNDAADLHIRVLEQAASAVPDEFLWQPEKAESTVLPMSSLIREAKSLRRAVKDISEDL